MPANESEPAKSRRTVAEAGAPAGGRLRAFVIESLAGTVLGPFIKLIAAILIGIGGIFMIVAWQTGPQRVIEAAQYSKLTARADAKITESWLAIEFDPSEMGTKRNWRPFAKASPCVVVEFQGDWTGSVRRAFCGNRFTFSDAYTLHDLTDMAPKVPFAWMRDASGFSAPEIRIDAAGKAWLEGHPPASSFMQSKPVPKTELEALQRGVDRPVDEAVAAWSTPVPVFRIAFDPKTPADAWPAGFVDDRLALKANLLMWTICLILAAVGSIPWFLGMGILFNGWPRAAVGVIGVAPLLALPWWGEQFPRALRALNKDFASVVADMQGDLDPLGRMIATAPERATLADGERIVWHVGTGGYADTFGRFRYTLPDPRPASGDAALAALARTVTAQARALPSDEQTALFVRLRADKANDARGAGIVFLPAAKEAMLDPLSTPPLRRAASEFLSAWTTQPIDEPQPRDAGYRERIRLYRILTDIANPPDIAIMAGGVVERAEKRP